MQLTRFTDYALRLLIFLAHQPEELTTIKRVADTHGISEDHLTKVVQRMSKLGYIRTVRGKNGGIGAARNPADISIGRVIRDVEPLAPVECFLEDYAGGCRLYPNCALRGVLQSAQSQFLKSLDACSVADVMGPSAWDSPGASRATACNKPRRRSASAQRKRARRK
jgi:Rrf2 family transcriptional regulator, nitric oxide-sensitive transcriptional repressor